MPKHTESMTVKSLIVGATNVKVESENNTTNIQSNAQVVADLAVINVTNLDVKAKNDRLNMKVGPNTEQASKYYIHGVSGGSIDEKGCATNIEVVESTDRNNSDQSQTNAVK